MTLLWACQTLGMNFFFFKRDSKSLADISELTVTFLSVFSSHWNLPSFSQQLRQPSKTIYGLLQNFHKQLREDEFSFLFRLHEGGHVNIPLSLLAQFGFCTSIFSTVTRSLSQKWVIMDGNGFGYLWALAVVRLKLSLDPATHAFYLQFVEVNMKEVIIVLHPHPSIHQSSFFFLVEENSKLNPWTLAEIASENDKYLSHHQPFQ